MGRQNFEVIKDDLLNLKNAEFNSVSATNAYGYMLKVVLGVMLCLSAIHIVNDYLVGAWASASAKEVFRHWLTAFTGYSIAGFMIFIFTKSTFIMFKQFETILKSTALIKQLKRNTILLFLVSNVVVDYMASGHLIGVHTSGSDAAGCNPWLSLLVVPSIIICAFFISFEIERLGVGPLFEAVNVAYQRIMGKTS